MSQESTAILRAVLFNAMIGEMDKRDISYMVRAVSAMCTKDDVAAVKEQVAEEMKARQEKK